MWGRGIRATHLEQSWIPPQGGGGRSCDQTGVVGVGVGVSSGTLAWHPIPEEGEALEPAAPPGEVGGPGDDQVGRRWGDGVWPH